MENMNSPDDLHQMLGIIDENIKKIARYTPESRVEGDQDDKVIIF